MVDDPIVADLRAAIGVDGVRVDAAERSLLSRDASVFRGGVAGPVCFPTSTADVQDDRADRRTARAFRRAPRCGHRARRRGDPARGAGRRLAHPDESDPRRRSRQPHRLGRTRRRQPRSHEAPRAARLPLRARSVEPAGVHHRRQRGQQLRRAALPRRRCHQRPCAGDRGRAARRRGGHARRARCRAARARPARCVRRRRGHAGDRHPDRRDAHQEPPGGADDAAVVRPDERRRQHGQRA